MTRLPAIAWFAAVATLLLSPPASAQNRAVYEKTIAVHAKANHVPEVLVHRVIVRESKYQPDLIGRGGTIGLMQIKLATARGLGYQGDAAGLRDPETNLTWGVKYLAGAYRAADNDHDRAMRLYASGYYEVAKRQRLERLKHPELALASAPPKDSESPKEAGAAPAATAKPEEIAKPEEALAQPETAVAKPDTMPKAAAKPKTVSPRKTAPRPKTASTPLDLIPSFLKPKAASKPHPKKLADAKERVPRPPVAVTGDAAGTKPR